MGASRLDFHVLLALASGALHGYAIAERVAAGPLNQRFRDSLQNVKRAVESQTKATV